MILDDPFSAVDQKTEREIFANLRLLAADRIVILISHRLQLFPQLDHVLFLEHGTSVLSTHSALMRETAPMRHSIRRRQWEVQAMKNKNGLGVVFRKTVRQNSGMTLLTGILIAACVAAALFPPLVLEQMVNRLTGRQAVSLVLPLGYFGLLVLSDLLESGQSVMITVFGQKMTHSLRSEALRQTETTAGGILQHTPAKITSRFVNDVDVVDSLFTNGIIGMVADAFKVLSILIRPSFIKAPNGILMLLVTPALFAMTRLFQKRMLKAQLANRVAVSKVNNHVPETIHNIRTIHTCFGKSTWKKSMIPILKLPCPR